MEEEKQNNNNKQTPQKKDTPKKSNPPSQKVTPNKQKATPSKASPAKKTEEKTSVKKSVQKSAAKKEEKEKQQEKANNITEQKKSTKKTQKKEEQEDDDDEVKSKSNDKDYNPANDEEDEEDAKQKSSKKGRGRGASGRKTRSAKKTNESEEESEEEVIRTTRSKRTKLDNRELYKSQLKEKKWPSAEQIKEEVQDFIKKIKDDKITEDMLRNIYSTIDLTSLNATDGSEYIKDWLDKQLFQVEKDHQVKPAAICVFPNFGKQVRKELKKIKNVKTAVVSTCFPTGQSFLETKLTETKIAVREGAEEVDMVVSRGLWNEGYEEDCLDEIYECKKNCSSIGSNNAHLKVILENCELKGLDQIYKLSYLSLCAGGDFIKTSTGKGKWGAKLEEFGAMLLALRDFLEFRKDKGETRGIKAAGGISDSKTAHQFYQLYELITGLKVTPETFRIGASSLCKAIVKDLADLKK